MRRRLERAPDDQGFTLIEMLVVIAILLIVGGITTNAIVTGFESTRKGQDRIRGLSDLEKGIERIGRELRVADPLLIDPDGNFDGCIGAEVFRDGKRFIIVYRLEVDPDDPSTFDLVQDIETYDDPDDTTPSTTNVGLFIDRIHSDALFTYFDQNGNPILGTDPQAYLTSAQVRINLVKQLFEQDPLAVTTVVNVRNARYGSDGLMTATCN